MNVLMKVMPPIFEENNAYGNSRSICSVKEECKKVNLFRIRVKGMSFEKSKQIVHEIREALYRPSGYIGLLLLSEVEWGYPVEYDKDTKTYDDCIVIPKDYDHPDEQFRAIVECIADRIYHIKMRYNHTSRTTKRLAKKVAA